MSAPKNIEIENLSQLLLAGIPFIDVRAPVEFEQGHLPGAINLPILNDEERALIGTTYKQKGQDEAVALGHKLVSGAVKDQRVQVWKEQILAHSQTVLYCFRGGQRSRITQQWLREAGVDVPLIVGGYKAGRQHLIDTIERVSANGHFLLVSGPTGSGKTDFLFDVRSFYPLVDLEGLARHRGSAFGYMGVQPSQVNFENLLAKELLANESKVTEGVPLLLEDESRLIGRSALPPVLFEKMRASKIIWIEESMETRVANIFKDYVDQTPIGQVQNSTFKCADERNILRAQARDTFERYRASVRAIQRKLGGLRAQELLADIDAAESDFLFNNATDSNKKWIEKLLVYYYDPLYLGSLSKRNATVVFKGSRAEALKYLQECVQLQK